MNKRLKEYFYFSKFERAGIIGLLVLVVLLIIARILLVEFYPKHEFQEKDLTRLELIIDSLE